MPEFLIRLNIGREMSWLEDMDRIIGDCSIMVSSTVLESFPKRFTSLLLKTRKPFIVDPYTHIFGYRLPELRDKRWFAKLLGFYGIDLIVKSGDTIIPLDALLDSKNQPTANLESFVDSVFTYQRNRIQNIYDEISEFEEFEDQSVSKTPLLPKYLIPPYFYIGWDSEKWLKVNIDCIKTAIKLRENNEKIYAVILIDKSILAFPSDVDEIVKLYNITGVDGYFVWITDFHENTAHTSELKSFRRFIEELFKFKKPIYNLYGGLFSFLLNKNGMKGVCHSICYGENKDPFSVGGMIASIRYYQPIIRSKVPYGKIDEIEKTLGLAKCNCENCKLLSKTDDSGKQMELCGKHFLLIRSKEIVEINNTDPVKILSQIKEIYTRSQVADRALAYENYYEQLDTWNKALLE